MLTLSIVVAVAENGVIGKDNQLPWHLPEDLKYFKRTTMGHPIVMGRKTFESIGRPLPGRTNIVVTRQEQWQADGVEVAHSLDDALAIANKVGANDGVEQAMLIGGAELYKQGLAACKHLYLTEVQAAVDGDAFFPELDRSEWREVRRESHLASDNNPHAYAFVLFERIS